MTAWPEQFGEGYSCRGVREGGRQMQGEGGRAGGKEGGRSLAVIHGAAKGAILASKTETLQTDGAAAFTVVRQWALHSGPRSWEEYLGAERAFGSHHIPPGTGAARGQAVLIMASLDGTMRVC